MPLYRNYSRYNIPTTIYSSLEEFFSFPLAEGANSIRYGDHLLDLMIWDRQSRTTVVVFHAAVDLNTATLPIFVGQHLVEGTHANVVFISDPSLDLGAPIGWFTGNSSVSLQDDLVRILEYIHRSLTESTHIIFFGASAGGFAALYYSHRFPGSLAIVANPQTDIAQYLPEAVERYLDRCWDSTPLEACPITSNVVELYGSSMNNYVLYLQNKDDELHLQKHFKPWSQATRSNHDRWQLVLGDWGEGHSPVPAFLLTGILGQAIELNGEWKSLLNDPELKELSLELDDAF